jgi:hypothetical protein
LAPRNAAVIGGSIVQAKNRAVSVVSRTSGTPMRNLVRGEMTGERIPSRKGVYGTLAGAAAATGGA